MVKIYNLGIYNDNVDENLYTENKKTDKKKILEVYFNSKTPIKHTYKTTEYDFTFSLFGLSFCKKMYEPGQILAEMQVVPTKGSPDIAVLKETLVKKKVCLTVTVDGGTPVTIADNYYIQEITPLFEKIGGSTSIYVRLSIFSLDNQLRLNPYSEAYLGRKLFNWILKQGAKKVNLVPNVGYLSHLSAALTDAAELEDYAEYQDKDDKDDEYYSSDREFVQPYLVQYNETFYDFMVRTANRCGEFLYFEDGKIQAGLDIEKLKNATDISNYSRLLYNRAAEGPFSVQLYARDAVKEFDSTKTVEGNRPTANKSNSNVAQVSKTGYYPDIYNTDNRVYNYEQGPDDMIIPLYSDHFSSGEIDELYANGVGKLFEFFGSVLKMTSLYDAVGDYTIDTLTSIIQAATAGDDLNDNGRELIEKFIPAEDVDKDNNETSVLFGSKNDDRWVTLKYYSDIRSKGEKAEREMVCAHFGDTFMNVKLGDVVTFDGGTTKYVVVGVEMQADQEWQRNYEKRDNSIDTTNPGCLKFYAVPTESSKEVKIEKQDVTIPLFYPPVNPNGAIRHSEPQPAIVIDNKDPKNQGRVRVRYPWQEEIGDEEKEKTKLYDIEQKLKALKENLKEYINDDGTEKKLSEITGEETQKKVKAWRRKRFMLTLDKLFRAEAATPWIRMTSPMATKGGGFYFKPEKGDEVLINYEGGNVERPYVVGALYSKNATTPAGKRIIKSPNGHTIRLDDPSDASKIASSIIPGFKFLRDYHMWPDCLVADDDNAKPLLGGITMTDAFGIYKISMSSHDRKVSIASPFGDVKIDAFTGISINAPNGDIRISGKNVEISANNNLTITSGKNIKKNIFGGMKLDKKWDTFNEEMAKEVARANDRVFGDFIDLPFLRSLMEIILRPVNGTMQIKSHSFLLLEAGKGSAAIPHSSYQRRALGQRTLKYDKSGYGGLYYIAAILVKANFGDMSHKVGSLFNEACQKLSNLKYQAPAPADGSPAPAPQHIFSNGYGAITSHSADNFVAQCLSQVELAKMNIVWDDQKKTDELVTAVEDAFNALRELRVYCSKSIATFKTEWNKGFDIEHKLANKLWACIMDDVVPDEIKNLHWVKKIRECSSINSNLRWNDFVGGGLVSQEVDLTTRTDYSEGVKRFYRYFIYNLLGDKNPTFPVSGIINDLDFIKSRGLSIVHLNDIAPTEGPFSREQYPISLDDIIKNTHQGWEKYIASLVLKDEKDDLHGSELFASTTEDTLKQKMMEKVQYLDDFEVWDADTKGRILMSDGSFTYSFDTPNAGTVNVKASEGAPDTATSTQYIKTLLLSVSL